MVLQTVWRKRRENWENKIFSKMFKSCHQSWKKPEGFKTNIDYSGYFTWKGALPVWMPWTKQKITKYLSWRYWFLLRNQNFNAHIIKQGCLTIYLLSHRILQPSYFLLQTWVCNHLCQLRNIRFSYSYAKSCINVANNFAWPFYFINIYLYITASLCIMTKQEYKITVHEKNQALDVINTIYGNRGLLASNIKFKSLQKHNQ